MRAKITSKACADEGSACAALRASSCYIEFLLASSELESVEQMILVQRITSKARTWTRHTSVLPHSTILQLKTNVEHTDTTEIVLLFCQSI